MKYSEIIEELHNVAELGIPFWVITRNSERLHCVYANGLIYGCEIGEEEVHIPAEELLRVARYLLPCY